ncbi:hypothetical protein E1301_Tti005560 [Triplophysa tibetana]|uniref:Peptidase S1 domain-containing protein n=1 Tax=Triplophysa tibetana TaxID=1572043 RepID=A0A5A9NG44_9TELE|nr:hypothetical protein E1301_Tti005560 [Triplophysa tibetana]
MENFTTTTCNSVRKDSLISEEDEISSRRFIPHFRDEKFFGHVVTELKSNPGPKYIKDAKIISHDNIILTCHSNCEILIWSDKEQSLKDAGLGYYYGSGCVLTVNHVIDYENCSIFVTFREYEFCMIYLAHIAKKNKDQDLAIIKLQGSLDPLQFKNIKNITNEIEIKDIYVFSLKPDGEYELKTGEIMQHHPSIKDMLKNELLISVAGINGDSGGPVCSNGNVVGLFRGASTSENGLEKYGRMVKIDKSFLKCD